MVPLLCFITYPDNGFTSFEPCHPHGTIATALYYRDPFQREAHIRADRVGRYLTAFLSVTPTVEVK